MSISFSGLGSGLPIDEWIEKLVAVQQSKVDTLTSQKNLLNQKQSALNTLKSEYSSVQSAATKFTDCLFGAGMDFFSKVGINISGQDKDNPYISASVTQYSTPSSIDLEVESLATVSVRKSYSFLALKNSANKLSELGVTQEGTFTINGADFEIKPDMTVDSLVYQINNSPQAGVSASLKDGRLVLKNKETGVKDLTVSGSGAVTDNGKTFDELLQLNTETKHSKAYNQTITGSSTMGDLGFRGDCSITLSNGKVVNFSEYTTIDFFTSGVNSQLQSGMGLRLGVVGLYVNDDNTLFFGESNVMTLPTGTTMRYSKYNWTDYIQDTPCTPDGRTFGEVLGFEKTYTEGTDAVFTINGDRKTSSTNTINSDVSGVLGLSLELKATTDNHIVNLDISRDFDSEDPLKYIQEFVDAFNKMIVDTNASTDSQNGGLLSGENSLVNIKTKLRSLITSPVSNSGIYRSLADIGISSGAPGLDVDADTTQLIIDKEKFLEAFKKDPNSVKTLLIGDTKDGVGVGNGLMQQVQEQLTPALDSKYGYFYARTESLTSQLKSMDEKIEKKNEYINQYRERLTKQFNYMDNLIAQMNNQFTQMQQQLKSIGVDLGDS